MKAAGITAVWLPPPSASVSLEVCSLFCNRVHLGDTGQCVFPKSQLFGQNDVFEAALVMFHKNAVMDIASSCLAHACRGTSRESTRA